MRDKLIDRIYKLSQHIDFNIDRNLQHLSNDELITLYAEVVIEHHLFNEYLWDQ